MIVRILAQLTFGLLALGASCYRAAAFQDVNVNQIRSLGNHRKMALRSKRSIAANYDDTHCLANFEQSVKTIIRTKESKANGAVFLNQTDLETFQLCLRLCCETPLCTSAIWDIKVNSS